MSVGYIAHESPLNLERDGAESFGEGSYLLGIALRLNRTMANTIFTASLRLQVLAQACHNGCQLQLNGSCPVYTSREDSADMLA